MPRVYDGLYTRLNRVGMGLSVETRDLCGVVARALRTAHTLSDDANDDLLELADQLDTLSAPIVVEYQS
jgi:hypothetical protein